MAVCTFDNPATMRRECWQDGGLVAAYSAELFFLKEPFVPGHLFHMGANIGGWLKGQIVGEKSAIGAQS